MKKLFVATNYEFNNAWTTANDTFVVGHDDSCHNESLSTRLT